MRKYTKETYSEICEFLELIGDKYVSMIPTQLLQAFEKNKSEHYIPHINPNIPVDEQSLNKDTLTIIALLNLKYWCKDKQELERLKSVYKNNEEVYQNKLREKYNYDNIFKNRLKEHKQYEIIEFVDNKTFPFYKKIANFIRRKFLKK